MRIIAFYLPQFHTIPENDEWWGKGFTEWTNVKKAKPLFEGHIQPKVPLNNNYYNLLNDDVKIWQANLAKEYGIYGFCYYHYWYNGKMLLEKPMEQMLKNKNVDIPFCIWWCNQPWTKSWVGNNDKILISQSYGNEEEWINHYNYLRQFFLDNRYILNDNKPIIGIYNPIAIGSIKDIKDCWEMLAKKDGFDGIDLMCTITSYDNIDKFQNIYVVCDHYVEWGFSLAREKYSKQNDSRFYLFLRNLKDIINAKFERLFGKNFPVDELSNKIKKVIKGHSLIKLDYDEIWKLLISFKPYCDKSLPGAFVNWDNTARYGERGSVMVNSSPDKFCNYLSAQIKNAKENYKTGMLFLQAWNEWAEWSVLEPDEDNGFSYLNALKNALIANNEFPKYE